MVKTFDHFYKSLQIYKRAQEKYLYQKRRYIIHDTWDKKVTQKIFWHKNFANELANSMLRCFPFVGGTREKAKTFMNLNLPPSRFYKVLTPDAFPVFAWSKKWRDQYPLKYSYFQDWYCCTIEEAFEKIESLINLIRIQIKEISKYEQKFSKLKMKHQMRKNKMFHRLNATRIKQNIPLQVASKEIQGYKNRNIWKLLMEKQEKYSKLQENEMNKWLRKRVVEISGELDKDLRLEDFNYYGCNFEIKYI